MTRPWDRLERADFDITLTIAGPVLSKSTGMRRPGLDAAFARDKNNRPILPGTHVAGHLSDAWELLDEAAPGALDIDPADWLGRASGRQGKSVQLRKNPRGGESEETANTNEPERRRLVFDDFILAGAVGSSGPIADRQRVRIAVGETGAVKPHALQFIEDVVPAGRDSEAVFCGHAYALGDKQRLDALECGLRVGLRSIERVGSNKGVGYGEVKSARVERTPAAAAARLTLSADASRFALIIRPRMPMLFSRPLAAGNTFESLDEIPGGAIKGALAELPRIDGASVDKWKSRSAFFRNFNAIRFGHAFPAYAAYRRPVRPPLSLARYGDDEQIDTALVGNPPPLFGGRALEYSPDWKPEFAARVPQRFGWALPRRDLRVRTAIDPMVRRAAEAQLFAYEMVLNEDIDGQRIEWYGYVDFTDVPEADRKDAVAELQELLQRFGLCLLGKTKANADAVLQREKIVSPAVAPSLDPVGYPSSGAPHWVLTLQTDAVLVSNKALGPDATAKSLCAAYGDIWHDISGGKLALVDYFARQKLAGGGYLYRRFPSKDPNSTGYEPIPLTEAGSVFVLKPAAGASREAAAEKVREFAERGLSLPQWAMSRQPSATSDAELWETLPYLRQNGFGEVAVNLATHSERSPWLTAALNNREGADAA